MNHDLSDPMAVASLLTSAAEVMRCDPGRTGSRVRIGSRGRLLVTGDVHDNPVHFERIQAFSHLERPDHHLVLHELIHGDRLINGVDLSHRMLARVAALVMRHPGRVHPLLANHELAQAFGQPVSKGAGENVALFDAGLEWAFGDDSHVVAEAIADFVKAMPLALHCENGIMVSHSLPGAFGMKRFDLTVLDRDLVDEDYEPNTGSAWLMVWGRGQTPSDLEALAVRWGVKLFLAGHLHAESGIEVLGPRLVILNSDHEGAMVLPVNLAEAPPPAEECPLHAIPVASLGALT